MIKYILPLLLAVAFSTHATNIIQASLREDGLITFLTIHPDGTETSYSFVTAEDSRLVRAPLTKIRFLKQKIDQARGTMVVADHGSS